MTGWKRTMKKPPGEVVAVITGPSTKPTPPTTTYTTARIDWNTEKAGRKTAMGRRKTISNPPTAAIPAESPNA